MSPPPAPWAPYGPPLDRADAATLSRSRLRPAAWGATRDSSNDGALRDGEKESIVDWNALAADGAEANLPDAERETRSVVPDFDAFLADRRRGSARTTRRRTDGVSRNGLRGGIARGAHARDIRGGIVRGGDDRRR